MFTLITRRRRAEDERVRQFLHAITLSDRYSVDPEWQLLEDPNADAAEQWPADPDATVAFPRILLTGTVL